MESPRRPRITVRRKPAPAADELTAVVADGHDKAKKGLLVSDTRKQFHADLAASMAKLRAALIDSLPEADKKAAANNMNHMSILEGQVATNKTARVKPIQAGSDECALCDEVLEKTSAICMLYELWCPVCTLICLSTAAIAYGRCVEDWCGDPSAGGGGGDQCDPDCTL
jgi:hypothetical protein